MHLFLSGVFGLLCDNVNHRTGSTTHMQVNVVNDIISKTISWAELSHADEMWHILLSGKWRRQCHILVDETVATWFINTRSQEIAFSFCSFSTKS